MSNFLITAAVTVTITIYWPIPVQSLKRRTMVTARTMLRPEVGVGVFGEEVGVVDGVEAEAGDVLG